MNKLFAFFIMITVYVNGFSQSPKYPFPKHETYTGNHIKPSAYTQDELDNVVKGFYDSWKAKYLKNSCGGGQYYVDFDEGSTICVSEGQGYGMMIVPLMAGYDTDAKTYFDGLYKFYKAHPSSINSNLMAWEQITGCVDNPDGGDDAATDGDIDIAYGLLLAHVQWGSTGEINYLQQAKNIINAIMSSEINRSLWTVRLGDWATDGKYNTSTRTSDFIMDHFRVFKCATNIDNWDRVVDTCYALVDNMQTNYSPQTGLLPGFIVNVNTTAKPADADFLEGENDGNYDYNACRDPWRLATDYLLFGDERAKTAVNKINSWLITKCNNNPDNIKSGYKLDGTATATWDDASFVGSFTVGAMLDNTNQQWLDDLFEKLKSYSFSNGDYFSNTLTMLDLLVISGNYWSPACDELLTGIERQEDNKNQLELIVDGDVLRFKSKQRYQNASIYDLNGKMFCSVKLNGYSGDIDIAALPKGCYFFKISNKSNMVSATSKFIVAY
jgi:endo-1,4-beta-D-glucanase Y